VAGWHLANGPVHRAGRAHVAHGDVRRGRGRVEVAGDRRVAEQRLGLRAEDQLVAAAQAFASRIRPQGDRLAVITNGGGPGVMAADRAADLDLRLAELSPATVDALRLALPSNWSHGNPIDLIGDADSARYRAAVSACLADPGVDGVLVVLTPQAFHEHVDHRAFFLEHFEKKGVEAAHACLGTLQALQRI